MHVSTSDVSCALRTGTPTDQVRSHRFPTAIYQCPFACSIVTSDDRRQYNLRPPMRRNAAHPYIYSSHQPVMELGLDRSICSSHLDMSLGGGAAEPRASLPVPLTACKENISSHPETLRNSGPAAGDQNDHR
jgi:hypothetical protein